MTKRSTRMRRCYLHPHTRFLPSHSFVTKLINSVASQAIAKGNGISLHGNSLQLKFAEITQPKNLQLTYLTTRQAVWVWSNIKERPSNHCCCDKAISITYSECVLVGVGIQHALRMGHTVICGLHGYTVFFSQYLINGAIFENNVTEHDVCFDFLYFRLKHVTLRRTEWNMIKNVYRPRSFYQV